MQKSKKMQKWQKLINFNLKMGRYILRNQKIIYLNLDRQTKSLRKKPKKLRQLNLKKDYVWVVVLDSVEKQLYNNNYNN